MIFKQLIPFKKIITKLYSIMLIITQLYSIMLRIIASLKLTAGQRKLLACFIFCLHRLICRFPRENWIFKDASWLFFMKYFVILIWHHQMEDMEKKLYRKSYLKGNAVLTKAIRGGFCLFFFFFWYNEVLLMLILWKCFKQIFSHFNMQMLENALQPTLNSVKKNIRSSYHIKNTSL